MVKACIVLCLLLCLTGCWRRVAIAKGVQRVEGGQGPVGQMVDELGDGLTDTSGHKTSATTSESSYSGSY